MKTRRVSIAVLLVFVVGILLIGCTVPERVAPSWQLLGGPTEGGFAAKVIELRWEPGLTFPYKLLVQKVDTSEVGSVTVTGQKYATTKVGDVVYVK